MKTLSANLQPENFTPAKVLKIKIKNESLFPDGNRQEAYCRAKNFVVSSLLLSRVFR